MIKVNAAKITNDQLRDILNRNGLTVMNVENQQLELLHKILSEELLSSDCFRGTFHMDDLVDPRYMTCSADYFEKREAVSFNRDGFIGFAGWASTENIIPIRKGVLRWAEVFA